MWCVTDRYSIVVGGYGPNRWQGLKGVNVKKPTTPKPKKAKIDYAMIGIGEQIDEDAEEDEGDSE